MNECLFMGCVLTVCVCSVLCHAVCLVTARMWYCFLSLFLLKLSLRCWLCVHVVVMSMLDSTAMFKDYLSRLGLGGV